MDIAIYGPLKTFFEREVNSFQKMHPGCIINQYDIARLLSPVYLRCALAINAVHGFEKPGIWPVNKYAFGEEDYKPAAVITGTSNMNVHPEVTNAMEVISDSGSTVETLLPTSPSLISEFIPPNSENFLSEIISSLSKTSIPVSSDFSPVFVVSQDSLKTPEKIYESS